MLVVHKAAAERSKSCGATWCRGRAPISSARDRIISAVTTPVTVYPSIWFRRKWPSLLAIIVGASRRTTMASKSQGGPRMSDSGRERCSPPTAIRATGRPSRFRSSSLFYSLCSAACGGAVCAWFHGRVPFLGSFRAISDGCFAIYHSREIIVPRASVFFISIDEKQRSSTRGALTSHGRTQRKKLMVTEPTFHNDCSEQRE